MIEGVEVKELATYPDERGFFRELIRVTDGFFGEGFAQLSHACMYPGVAKAWHVHPTQVDWWYVAVGNLKIVLADIRKESSTFGEQMVMYLGQNYPASVIKIPNGVAHGCRALGDTTHLIYVTSSVYDPDEEGRIAHDDESLDYDWTAFPEIT
jgi:dTDP-4-dehydrorhamnose 3,5-epimerase